MALPITSRRMALFTVFPDMFFSSIPELWVHEPGQQMASENRCEYVHVRLLLAFHGSEHFRKPFAARAPLTGSGILFGL
jgi:hypothetical protein